jgi:hypothetical protein
VWRDSDGIIYYGSGLRAGLPRKGWIGPPFPQKMRSTTTLSTLCLVAWLDFGGSVRLKRPMRPLGGSVRLKRPMRPLGGSVRLKRPMRPWVEVCALSALCAIRVGLGGVFVCFLVLER